MAVLKVGIAGFGKMGQIRAREVNKRSDVELVAVFEPDATLAEHIPANVKQCASYSELLEHKLDAVFVCAFNHVAASYCIDALNAGLHVFCEKPPATTSRELLRVVAAEKASGRVLKYGFNHRLHYSVQEAAKLIDEGSFGKLLWVRGVYGKAGSIDYHKNWRNFKQYSGGGILMDQGIHMLDLIYFLTKRKFTPLCSQLNTSFWDIDVEDNAFVTMRHDDVIATVHSSATQWKHKFLLEMCFEEGYINLDGILSESRSYAPEKLIYARREFEDVTFAMGKPAERTVWFENDDSWKLELEEFISAVTQHAPIKNGNSDDAMHILTLIEAIYHNSNFYHSK